MKETISDILAFKDFSSLVCSSVFANRVLKSSWLVLELEANPLLDRGALGEGLNNRFIGQRTGVGTMPISLSSDLMRPILDFNL